MTAYERAEAEREFDGEFDDAEFESPELEGRGPDVTDRKDSDFDEENAA